MQRELLRIVRAVGQQQHAPAVLAAQLDNWSRRYFHLSRIESRHCPDGIGNPLWESWVATLQHIRFDAPHAAHFAELNTLCRTAQSWLRR